ncbi:lytic transglycosylase domain-containing protein [Priestia aryabhattai]
MDITNIQSTLSDSEISSLKNSLSQKKVNESQFDEIIKNIETTTKSLENNYKSEHNLFPNHNFIKVAFKQVLDNLDSGLTNSTSQEEANSSETSIVTNKVSTLSTSGTNNSAASSNIINTNSLVSNVSSANNISSNTSIKQISGNNKYDSIISEMALKYNVPFDLIKAVINAESSFNSNATSSTGAMGLMQLMPATAKWLGVNNAYNARDNIEGGAKYLSYLLNRFNGDTKLAVAGYNAGPGNVEKYKGIPPFQETQNYVKKILV